MLFWYEQLEISCSAALSSIYCGRCFSAVWALYLEPLFFRPCCSSLSHQVLLRKPMAVPVCEMISLIVPSSSFRVLDLVLKPLGYFWRDLWTGWKKGTSCLFSTYGYPGYLGPFAEHWLFWNLCFWYLFKEPSGGYKCVTLFLGPLFSARVLRMLQPYWLWIFSRIWSLFCVISSITLFDK